MASTGICAASARVHESRPLECGNAHSPSATAGGRGTYLWEVGLDQVVYLSMWASSAPHPAGCGSDTREATALVTHVVDEVTLHIDLLLAHGVFRDGGPTRQFPREDLGSILQFDICIGKYLSLPIDGAGSAAAAPCDGPKVSRPVTTVTNFRLLRWSREICTPGFSCRRHARL